MIDYYLSNLSLLQFLVMIFCAILVGFNKTGMPGIGVLPVVILTMIFPARLSTGIQLLMLCSADVMALCYYRKQANWHVIIRVLPFAVLGLCLGSLVLNNYATNDSKLKMLIGIIILFIVVLNIIRKNALQNRSIPKDWWMGAIAGAMVGFTTQIANAAGPVVAIYLLALNLPKSEYMGTCVWFFVLVNWLKLPIFIWEDRISLDSLYIMLPMLPFLFLGAVLGVFTLKKLSTDLFETLIQIVVLLSAIKLIFFP